MDRTSSSCRTDPFLILDLLGVFGHGILFTTHLIGALFTWLVGRRGLSSFHALGAAVSALCFIAHLFDVLGGINPSQRPHR